MEGTRGSFFDPETIAILKGVLDEAWSCLPAGQTDVTQSLLAERILKAARDGERDPDRLRTHAIADGNEGGTQGARFGTARGGGAARVAEGRVREATRRPTPRHGPRSPRPRSVSNNRMEMA